MFRILYRSTATRPFTPDELSELLRRARTNNQQAGLTGMLVYSNGDFLQVLEGEPTEVIRVFDVISLDPRHREIEVLQRGVTYGDRKFSQWSMGFKRVDGGPAGEQWIVAINGRIRLRDMDALDALGFLEASAKAQTQKD